MVECLRSAGIDYVALNPGASIRGLHDSLVNVGPDRGGPGILLCLHEDAAVAIAHGYAKVTGRPLAVGLHANVGLMHATMGLFNAFCDRVPMLVLGGNGPMDATQRRPWIDWIHTTQDPAALIRSYVKWDDQPASVPAALDALLDAVGRTTTYPCAPVYVGLDASLQEQELAEPMVPPRAARYLGRTAMAVPDADSIGRAADLLAAAAAPVVLVGRVSRDEPDWQRRVELAELLGAAVVTDFKVGAGFPTSHALQVNGVGGLHLSTEAIAVLRDADVVLALDWLDLGSSMRQVWGSADPDVVTIVSSADAQLHNGWSKDGGAPFPADLVLPCAPDVTVAHLVNALAQQEMRPRPNTFSAEPAMPEHAAPDGPLRLQEVAAALRRSLGVRPVCLVRAPHRGWPYADWPFEHPLDFLGYDGGGGLGSGPGMTVGAALALRGSERTAVAVIGDGDYLQGVTAVWTAAAEKLPLLLVVANNGTYQTDELHQVVVAERRGRPVENAGIGQRFDTPAIDLAGLARAQGATGLGPIRSRAELTAIMDEAVAALTAGATVVVDAVVAPY